MQTGLLCVQDIDRVHKQGKLRQVTEEKIAASVLQTLVGLSRKIEEILGLANRAKVSQISFLILGSGQL